MLSTGIVREVSRTSTPASVAGWTLTVEELIRRTTGADWRHGYLVIRAGAAKRVAREINRERPWVTSTSSTPILLPAIARPALPAAEDMDAALLEALREDAAVAAEEVLEGVLVD